MARIRSIKPEFWTSLTIAKLSPLARLTFIGLWNYCDDHGRGIDDARLIKATVWPLDDHATVKRIEGWMGEIHALGLVRRYDGDGTPCVAVTNWTEHQRVDHAKDSLLPPPPSREIREAVAKPPEAVALEGKGTGSREVEQGISPSLNGATESASERSERTKLKDAIVDALGWNADLLTPRLWKRIEVTAKEFADGGFDVDDIAVLGAMSAQHWPDVDRTPETLIKAIPHIERWRTERKRVRR